MIHRTPVPFRPIQNTYNIQDPRLTGKGAKENLYAYTIRRGQGTISL